jgi:segregation and condensation protein B
MLSNSHAAGYIREFYKTKSKEKLSRPSLESLAIIAYKQPVSRADLEIIRGVNCDGTVAHLLNKGLIEIVGRKEVPGRPFLYGTTKSFLEYFGLRSLEDLPKLESLPQLSQIETIQQADVVPVEDSGLSPAGQQEPATEQETQGPPDAGQESSGQSRLMQETAQENTQE